MYDDDENDENDEKKEDDQPFVMTKQQNVEEIVPKQKGCLERLKEFKSFKVLGVCAMTAAVGIYGGFVIYNGFETTNDEKRRLSGSE